MSASTWIRQSSPNWTPSGFVAAAGPLIFELPSSAVPADGSLLFKGVAKGDYRVSVVEAAKILENAYVKSIRFGTADVLTSGLHIDRDPVGSLQIVIGINVGRLDGRVFNAQREPIAGVPVVLMPTPAQRFRTDLYKTTATDGLGRFHLDGIAPGDYMVFAWEDVEEGAWLDPYFMRFYEDRGTPIGIGEGRGQTIEVPAIPRRL